MSSPAKVSAGCELPPAVCRAAVGLAGGKGVARTVLNAVNHRAKPHATQKSEGSRGVMISSTVANAGPEYKASLVYEWE